MIRDGDNPEICYRCFPPHVENCGTCFGFGVNYENIPISAGEVEIFKFTTDWFTCSECDGNLYNNHLLKEIELPQSRLDTLQSYYD